MQASSNIFWSKVNQQRLLITIMFSIIVNVKYVFNQE